MFWVDFVLVDFVLVLILFSFFVLAFFFLSDESTSLGLDGDAPLFFFGRRRGRGQFGSVRLQRESLDLQTNHRQWLDGHGAPLFAPRHFVQKRQPCSYAELAPSDDAGGASVVEEEHQHQEHQEQAASHGAGGDLV